MSTEWLDKLPNMQRKEPIAVAHKRECMMKMRSARLLRRLKARQMGRGRTTSYSPGVDPKGNDQATTNSSIVGDCRETASEASSTVRKTEANAEGADQRSASQRS